MKIATFFVALFVALSTYAADFQKSQELFTAFSSIDRENYFDSLALTQAIESVLSDLKDPNEKAKLRKQIDDQVKYQDGIMGMARAVVSSREFISMNAKMESSEIAFLVASNTRYRRFQMVDGLEFDKQPTVQRFESDVRRDMAVGLIDNLVNPYSQAALVRHRAALRMILNRETLLKDKLFALDFLTRSARAITGQ